MAMELTGSVAGMLKLLGGGSDVEITQVLTEGVAIALVKVDDDTITLYAPDGGSDVVVTPTLLTGSKVADIEVNGETVSLYAPTPTPATEVDITQVVTEGTKIATITVDNVPTDLYAPEGGSGGGVTYSTDEVKVGTYTENGVDYDLYEKTYNLTLSSNITQVSLADLGIRKLIHVDGIIFKNTDEIIMPFYENSSHNGITKFNKGNNMLQIILSNDTFSYYKDAIYNIFYTKNS